MDEIDNPGAEPADPQDQAITRREAVKLAGIVTALGAGLGVTGEAEAGQNPGVAQEKQYPGQLQVKLYTAPDVAGRQQLLYAIPIPMAVHKRLLTAPGGRVQAKIEISPTASAGSLLPAVQKRTVIVGEGMMQIKAEPSGDRGIRRR